MATCKRCGAPIDFIRTPAGKNMPVQRRGVYAREDRNGKHLALDVEGRVLRVSEAGPDDPDALVVRFPHWAFCPAAAELRQPKAPAAPSPPAQSEPEPRKHNRDEQLSFLGGMHGERKDTRGEYWRL